MAPTIPKYFPKIKCNLETGFDNTANAVPELISLASEDEAHNTAASNPERKVTVNAPSLTILTSKFTAPVVVPPNPK